jgi:phage shock protein A
MLEAEQELELELELFEDLVAAAREIALLLTAENKELCAKIASMKTEMNLIQGQGTKGQDLNLRCSPPA